MSDDTATTEPPGSSRAKVALAPTDYVLANYAMSRALLGSIGPSTSAIYITFQDEWVLDVYADEWTAEDIEEYEDAAVNFTTELEMFVGSVSEFVRRPMRLRYAGTDALCHSDKRSIMMFSRRWPDTDE